MPLQEGQKISTQQWRELKRRARVRALIQGLTFKEVLVLALTQWLDQNKDEEEGGRDAKQQSNCTK